MASSAQFWSFVAEKRAIGARQTFRSSWVQLTSPLVAANLFGGREGGEEEDGDREFSFAQNANSQNNFRIRIGGIFNWQGQGDPRHIVKLKTYEWNHIGFVREGRAGI